MRVSGGLEVLCSLMPRHTEGTAYKTAASLELQSLNPKP